MYIPLYQIYSDKFSTHEKWGPIQFNIFCIFYLGPTKGTDKLLGVHLLIYRDGFIATKATFHNTSALTAPLSLTALTIIPGFLSLQYNEK